MPNANVVCAVMADKDRFFPGSEAHEICAPNLAQSSGLTVIQKCHKEAGWKNGKSSASSAMGEWPGSQMGTGAARVFEFSDSKHIECVL